MQDDRCSTLSFEAGEPLSGTAVAETCLWVVLEQPSAWGPKGLSDSALPAAVVERLSRLEAAHPRLRVQLIRRPDREAARFALYLARSTPGHEALFFRELSALEAAAEVDFEAFVAGAEPAGFVRREGPLFLVCVHGKRDRCCAQRGMPVYSALSGAGPDEVFQTTHLGGHRFAATLLVLPDGICYGRVEPHEAQALREAHARREIYALSRMRGRSAYDSAAQAAEIALREQLGERSLSALSWLRTEADADGLTVCFRHEPTGREHTLRVTREKLAAFPKSCGDAPKPGEALIALTSR